jgi:hypothetical protein
LDRLKRFSYLLKQLGCLRKLAAPELNEQAIAQKPFDVVAMWRAGVTVPCGSQCRQLAELLKVEADWLCVVRP